MESLRPVADSWVYDTHMKAWSSLPPLAEPRGMAAVGVYKEKIFLAGGFTLLELRLNGMHASCSPVSVFDTRTSKWVSEALPAKARYLPGPRDHSVSAVIDGKMYVVGGYDHGAHNRTDTVFILDLDNLEEGWKTAAARMPTPRGGISGGTVGSKIYIFGGERPPGELNELHSEVEVYDVEGDTWTKLDPMPRPRHSAPGVAVHGKVYIPGGGVASGAAPISDFNVFNTTSETFWQLLPAWRYVQYLLRG
ncbi:galactose oxidase [Byssothecium circinans]|uniref:Galactose oxidase n=1 Tax=Byssothecium circinans TaxID=147558 RepID=A0A6A5TFN8_9PLEO|nr:galactose oxidase [Byssothecium circinans]